MFIRCIGPHSYGKYQ